MLKTVKQLYWLTFRQLGMQKDEIPGIDKT